MDSNIWPLALSKMDRFPQLIGEPNYISSYIRIKGWTAYRYFIWRQDGQLSMNKWMDSPKFFNGNTHEFLVWSWMDSFPQLGWTLSMCQCRMDSRIILLPIGEQQDGQLVAISYVDKMDSSNYKDGQPNYSWPSPNYWDFRWEVISGRPLALSKIDRFPQLLGEPNYTSS